MDAEKKSVQNVKNVFFVLIAVLLFSFHYFLVYFTNSTVLRTFVDEKYVGFFYTIGAIFNIILFLKAPAILNKIGNFKFTLIVAIVEFAAIAGIGLSSSELVVIPLFIAHQAIAILLFYVLDIFIERYSDEKNIGNIRGLYLTMSNLPLIITPFVVGFVTNESLPGVLAYSNIYLLAAAFIIPFLYIIITNFRKFPDPVYPHPTIKDSAITFYENKNLREIFADHILLHTFYGVWAIYMPIYLKTYIGFSWAEIGIIFSVMLLPFIFFQIPLGKIEDKYHNEKDILMTGFMILAISTILIAFLEEKNIVIWAALLFTTRIGACLIEISSESFFFKHIKAEDASFMSFFRLARTIPYLYSPFVAALLLTFFGFKGLFIFLGIFMLLGLRYTFYLSDGKKESLNTSKL